MLKSRIVYWCLLLFLSPALHAEMPAGKLIEVSGAQTAVILAHGRAQGPDGQVVGLLRQSISQDAGLTTLAVQLPVLESNDYLAYAATFPEAFKTLQSAVDFLGKEKGIKRVVLLGYSMGARMSTAFLASANNTSVIGYVGIGVLEGGGELLDGNKTIAKLKVPVLDLYADATPLDLKSAENRKSLLGSHFKQVRLAGANHSFKGYEADLSRHIVAWLKVL